MDWMIYLAREVWEREGLYIHMVIVKVMTYVMERHGIWEI